MVRDGLDVEEHRAGNVAGEIFGVGVTPLRGQDIGAVDDGKVGSAELRSEPIGRDKPTAGQLTGRNRGHDMVSVVCGSSAADLKSSACRARSARYGRRREGNADTSIQFPLLLDLSDVDRADLAGAADMRSAARLQVEPGNFDQADAAGSH